MAAEKNSTGVGLGKMAGFAGLMAVVLYGTDLALSHGLRSLRTSQFGVLNEIMDGRVNAEIVISGSSRALSHYDPRIIAAATGRTAYNIGRNGSQTDLQLAFLRAYLRHNAKPRLIIHNLDLFSFVTSREIYDPVQYVPYLSDAAIYAGVGRVYPDAWKWKYLPLYGYVVPDLRFSWVRGVQGLLGRNSPEDHFRGFLPRDRAWTDDFESFRRNHADGVVTEIEPRGVEDLTGIIQLCRTEHIPLLFVYSPEFAEMQALERNRAEVFARFESLCRQFDIPLWDYSASPLSLRRENFYNSQHLNAGGAAVFSQELGRRLAASELLPRDPIPVR